MQQRRRRRREGQLEELEEHSDSAALLSSSRTPRDDSVREKNRDGRSSRPLRVTKRERSRCRCEREIVVREGTISRRSPGRRERKKKALADERAATSSRGGPLAAEVHCDKPAGDADDGRR